MARKVGRELPWESPRSGLSSRERLACALCFSWPARLASLVLALACGVFCPFGFGRDHGSLPLGRFPAQGRGYGGYGILIGIDRSRPGNGHTKVHLRNANVIGRIRFRAGGPWVFLGSVEVLENAGNAGSQKIYTSRVGKLLPTRQDWAEARFPILREVPGFFRRHSCPEVDPSSLLF